MKSLLLCAALATVSFAAGAADAPRQGTKIYGDAARGRVVTEMWCVGCHSAGPTVDDRIPSFPALARNLSHSEGAIRAFLMQPHKPMPPLEISTQQIEDIIVYLRSYRPESPR
jgi:mono/diheme cytochrome c family protein